MIFILCAGNAVRFGGISKQLLTITRDGKNVLDRLIHQVGECTIVTHNPEIIEYAQRKDIPLLYPEIYDITPHTALSTSPYWEEYNLFLVGDGVYSAETLDIILSTRKDICFFGDIYEVCAVSFTDKELAKKAFDVPKCNGRYYGKLRQAHHLLYGVDCDTALSREKLIESPYYYNIDDAMTFDLDTQYIYDCVKRDYIDTGLLDY
jgi:hypothetical protein